jgi:invasion protein IalB
VLTQSPYLSQEDRERIAQVGLVAGGGAAAVPYAPVGTLAPPTGVEVSESVTVTWDGSECSYAGSSTTFPSGTVVRFDFVNASSAYHGFSVHHSERGL